jgi:hypothetical protein
MKIFLKNFVGFFSKRADEISDLKSVVKMIRHHLSEINKHKEEINPEIFDATKYIWEENCDILLSIIILYKKRQYKSCLILARNILESSANLKYIYSKNSEKRASTYLSFSFLAILKGLEKCEDEHRDKESMINGIRYTIEHNYFPEGNNKNCWNGFSVRDVFDEIKWGMFYEDIYSRLSGFIHGKYGKKIDIEIKSPYFEFLREVLFKHLPVFILESFKAANDKYDILGGVTIIDDYPKRGAIFCYSINKHGNPVKNSKQ